MQDPSTYDERQLKKLLNSKPENQPEHRILVKFNSYLFILFYLVKFISYYTGCFFHFIEIQC